MSQKFPDIDDLSSKVEKFCFLQNTAKKTYTNSKTFKMAVSLNFSPFSHYLQSSAPRKKRPKERTVSNFSSDNSLNLQLLKGIKEAQRCCDDQSFRLEHLKKILLEGHIQVHQISSYKPIDLKHLHAQFLRMGAQMRACLQKKISLKAHRLKKNQRDSSDPYLMMSKKKGDLKIM